MGSLNRLLDRNKEKEVFCIRCDELISKKNK